MLRLNPAHPPLWRSGTEVQFGVPAVAVLRDPLPWQERLLRELEAGVSADAAEVLARSWGASPGDCALLLTRLAPALSPSSPPASGGRIIVAGADAVPASATRTIADGVSAGGGRVEGSGAELGWNMIGSPEDVVIVVAHHLLHPAIARTLLARDVPHVPLALQGERIEVGPVIAPGRTACAACVAEECTRDDPAWPVLAAQLVTRDSGTVRPGLMWEAGLVAMELIARAADAHGATSHSVTVRSGSLQRTVRTHAPSAGCGCRSLGGTGRDGVLEIREPRSERGFAQPA